MKSILPWFCLVTAANINVAFAADGLDAYREGHYIKAAQALTQDKNNDPIVNYYLGRMRLYGYGQLKNNTLAIRHFEQAAEKGYLPAQQIMARYALLEQKDPESALYWFKKSAAADDVNAQMYCAAAYLFGVGTKKNSDVANKYFIAAARNGNDVAQVALAENFLGTRQAANKKLGLIWLNKAIERNNPKAQVLMSQLYMQGSLMPRDVAKAKEYAELAIKQNYAPALVQMGKIAVAENDYAAAKNWYTKASNAQYAPAEMELSSLYFNPKVAFHDEKEGFLWMLKAAQNGSIDAQYELADLYKKGLGTEQSDSLATEWQQRAKASSKVAASDTDGKIVSWLTNGKSSKFIDTAYRLPGILGAWTNPSVLKENNYNPAPQMDKLTRDSLYKPQFVMVDPNAIPFNEYYNAIVATMGALEQSAWEFPSYAVRDHLAQTQTAKPMMSPAATSNDEYDYLHQLTAASPNKPLDLPAIFKKLESQAILGDATAQFDIAQMYQHGLGVAKDMNAAMKYYRLSAAQQDLRAEYTLAVIYLTGEGGVDKNYPLGLKILTDAAFKGNGFAQYALARINEQGYTDATGTEIFKPNQEQALAMYNMAAANDFGPAEYRLAEMLVREKPTDLSQANLERRAQLIKSLYQGAVDHGVEQASLPLAFYNAMDADKAKQALAFTAAKKAADTGNTEAALLLGLMYDRGISVPVNHKEALGYYEKARKNPIDAFVLGTYLSQGNGISKDSTEGQALLQQAAQAGFSYANLNLAIMQQQSKGDFIPTLKQAHEMGNNIASILLADYYLSIAGNSEQMKQAHAIYQNLAEQGNRDGQVKLAYLLEHGLSGNVDQREAQKWYNEAAVQGQTLAQYLLARSYQLGWLTQQPDYELAKKWYAAAEAKYAPAAVALGFIYDTVDDDYRHALIDYQHAAQLGDSIGQYNLGLIYEKGKGVPVDLAKARALYAQAAEKNLSQAMVQLGGFYLNGYDVARDEKQAFQWYQKAATLGNRIAMYQLGVLLETGVGVTRDYTQAMQYYKQAATKGNEKAMLAMARMYQYGLGVPKDLQQATEIYQKLSLKDNPYAQYQLAMLYYNGALGDAQPAEGRRLLLQAEKNGNLQARKTLESLETKAGTQVSLQTSSKH